MPVRTLVEKAEIIVAEFTHMDLRGKLVELLIETIRIKGNGKDAKQLGIRLK